jgi:hypothetical protein
MHRPNRLTTAMTARDLAILVTGIVAMLVIFGLALLLELPAYFPLAGLLVLWVVPMYAYRNRL